MKYVVGFLFDRNLQVLLQRQRPGKPYTGGKLNGIGGKIEIGETPNGAMRREAAEEADLVLPGDKRWQQFHYERHASGTELYFYTAILDWVFSESFGTRPEGPEGYRREELVVVPVRHVIENILTEPTVPNLSYLLPMAVHWICNPFERYLEG